MEKLKIKAGAKMNVAIAGRKNENFSMKASFEKNLSDSSFLMSAPILNGQRVVVDNFVKLLFRYEIESSTYVIEGYVDDYVKIGIRNYWKVRKTSENRQFYQRSNVRVKTELKLRYFKKWWALDGTLQEEAMDALTVDISGGGLAMYGNTNLAVGEVIDLVLPSHGRRKAIDLRAEVCWVRETEKGNAYRYMTGLKFIFTDAKSREKVDSYVEAMIKDKKKDEA